MTLRNFKTAVLILLMISCMSFAQAAPASICPTGIAHCAVITWVAPTPVNAGVTYEVYKFVGIPPAVSYATVAAAQAAGFVALNSGIQALTATDTTVTVGTTYTYFVTAVAPGFGQSAPSNLTSTTIPTPVETPPTGATAVPQ